MECPIYVINCLSSVMLNFKLLMKIYGVKSGNLCLLDFVKSQGRLLSHPTIETFFRPYGPTFTNHYQEKKDFLNVEEVLLESPMRNK